MNTWICIAPCALIAIGLAMFAWYAILEDIYGPQGVKLVWRHELLQFFFTTLLVIGVSLALEAVSEQQFEVFIIGAITVSGLAVAFDTLNIRRRNRTSHAVLLKCTERKKPAFISLAIMIVLGVMVVTAMLIMAPQADSAYRAAVILLGVLIGLAGLNVYYRTRQPLIATAKGIISGAGIYRWDRIRTYYIAPAQRSAPLILRVRAWIPLTDTAIVPLALDEVDEVSALLADRLPGLRYAEQSPSDVGDTATKLV